MNIYRILKKLLWKIKCSDIGGFLYIILRRIMLVIAQLFYRVRYAKKPIQNNKIVCLWSPEESYCCNQKAIIRQLHNYSQNGFDIVCILGRQSAHQVPDFVRYVDYNSNTALDELATAKIWIFHNQSQQMYFRGIRKKKKQILIQTWHGSLGIKTIGTVASTHYNNRWGLYLAEKTSGNTDFWISNSTWETEIFQKSFPIVKEVLLYGHPRNDILIQQGAHVSETIKAEFNIKEKKVLLYAPSYRDEEKIDCFDINKDLLIKAMEERFGGEWVIMYRLHPRLKKYGSGLIPDSEQMINVTDYPDIQDLMLGVDALLTDFSSCIFDFMLTGRPGFIYAPDLDAYDQDRGFYYPLETTPFPIGKTNEELAEKIRSFDMVKYAKDVSAFLEEKGCMEDGHASERVVQKISELVEITE